VLGPVALLLWVVRIRRYKNVILESTNPERSRYDILYINTMRRGIVMNSYGIVIDGIIGMAKRIIDLNKLILTCEQ
jgi:hypothetical protein